MPSFDLVGFKLTSIIGAYKCIFKKLISLHHDEKDPADGIVQLLCIASGDASRDATL